MLGDGSPARQPLLPRVMGHRGAMAYAPENTLAGLQAAAESGVDWVEFDVMVTGDGQPVLFHDEDLERTIGVTQPLAKTTWTDLCQLDAGSWFDPAFAAERVPSLAQAVELLLALGLRPNVEIKPTGGDAAATAEIACDLLADIWPKDQPPPLISSFKREALAVAKTRLPEWPRGFVAEHLPHDWLATVVALDCRTVHLHWPTIDAETATLILAAGYELAIFTVNEPAQAEHLIELGVDCIITDRPTEILAAVGAL